MMEIERDSNMDNIAENDVQEILKKCKAVDISVLIILEKSGLMGVSTSGFSGQAILTFLEIFFTEYPPFVKEVAKLVDDTINEARKSQITNKSQSANQTLH
jgi:hypothetical protein